MHFVHVHPRGQCLIAQSWLATVPPVGRAPGQVEQRHGIATSGPAVGAEADGDRVAERPRGVVTAGAGLVARSGEAGVIEQGCAQGNALVRQGVVDGQGRLRETGGHDKGVWRDLGAGGHGGGARRGGGRSRQGAWAGRQPEPGAFQGGGKLRCEKVVGRGVGRLTCVAGFQRVGGEHTREVESEGDAGVAAHLVAGLEAHGHDALVGGEMVQETPVGGAVEPGSLQGGKDVSTLPVPMQTVDQRVERMAGRPPSRVAVVDVRSEADPELQSGVLPVGHAAEREGEPAAGRIQTPKLAFKPHGVAVDAHQAHLGEQGGKAGDVQDLAGVVCHRTRGHRERLLAPPRFHGEREIRPGE